MDHLGDTADGCNLGFFTIRAEYLVARLGVPMRKVHTVAGYDTRTSYPVLGCNSTNLYRIDSESKTIASRYRGCLTARVTQSCAAAALVPPWTTKHQSSDSNAVMLGQHGKKQNWTANPLLSAFDACGEMRWHEV
jgi:hypothetical protein